MNKKFIKKELDLDFYLLAISTPLKDYQLVYAINNNLEVDFKKIDDLVIELSGDIEHYFSLYHFRNFMNKDFYIIGNKCKEGYLIPELKESNFFLMLRNFHDLEDLKYYSTKLKSLNDIQLIININPLKLKSKENLIF